MDKITLLDYQKTGLQWCIDNEDKCCILAYDMGLGKTIVACELLNKKPMTTLIIVPPCIIQQWKSELEKFTSGFNIVLYHGSSRIKMRTQCESANIIITTSHTLANDILEKEVLFLENIKRIVIDEAHQLRNMKSKIYTILQSYIGNVENKVFLTGTPICNDPRDLIALVCLSNIKKYNKIDLWNGMQNKRKMLTLNKITDKILLRRTKIDTNLQLPSITFQDIKIKLEDGEQKDTYLSFMYDDIIIRRILRMRQSLNNHKCLIECDKEFVESSVKIVRINKIISQIDKNDKIIIFSFFATLLCELYEEITLDKSIDRKKHIQLYYGKMNTKEKNDAIDTFKNNSDSRILLINLRSGGCGLNLIEANHVILTEPYWNESEQEQAYNRVYRIGQVKPVYVYRLSIQNSIELWLKNIQKIKKSISNNIIDDKKDVSIEDILKDKSENVDILHKYINL